MLLFVYREEEYLKKQKADDQFGVKNKARWTAMEAVRNKVQFLVPSAAVAPPAMLSASSLVQTQPFATAISMVPGKAHTPTHRGRCDHITLGRVGEPRVYEKDGL